MHQREATVGYEAAVREALGLGAMTPTVWAVIMLLMAPAWLLSDLRQTALERFSLYLTLALACGVAAVGLRLIQVGTVRRAGLVLLFALCWAFAVTWIYMHRTPNGIFNVTAGLTAGLGAVVLPMLAVIAFGSGRSGAAWTITQVVCAAVVAAPLSSLLALLLSVLALREGP